MLRVLNFSISMSRRQGNSQGTLLEVRVTYPGVAGVSQSNNSVVLRTPTLSATCPIRAHGQLMMSLHCPTAFMAAWVAESYSRLQRVKWTIPARYKYSGAVLSSSRRSPVRPSSTAEVVSPMWSARCGSDAARSLRPPATALSAVKISAARTRAWARSISGHGGIGSHGRRPLLPVLAAGGGGGGELVPCCRLTGPSGSRLRYRLDSS